VARRTRLTPQIIDAIVERVRVGVFPYIAAQAVGIPKSTFYDWMRRGEKGRKPFSELLARVREAAATARSNAELRVFRDKPLEWLRLGPGREKPGEPGWTESPTTLRVEGGDTPVRLQPVHPVPIQTLAAAFAELQRLGYIQPGEQGKLLFSEYDQATKDAEDADPIDVQSTPGNGNGQPGP